MEPTMLAMTTTRTSLYNGSIAAQGVSSASSSSSSDGTTAAVAATIRRCSSQHADHEPNNKALTTVSSIGRSNSDDSEDEEATTSSGEVSPPYSKSVMMIEDRALLPPPPETINSLNLDHREDSGCYCCRPRRVGFSFVEIRLYGITIGDHPLTNMYPLTLDWCYVEEEDEDGDIKDAPNNNDNINSNNKLLLSVDEFERMKEDHEERPLWRRSRRGNAMVMSSSTPLCRGIKAPRLTVNQRIERLVDVTGMNSRELFALERQRQIRVQEESSSFGHHYRLQNHSTGRGGRPRTAIHR